VSLVVRVASADQMRQLGTAIGRVARSGDRFLLEGPFGAGKTIFVQGLAVGLGVEQPVSSPSFVIEIQHRGRVPLYHVDLYRLERVDEDVLQALDEHEEGVLAIEWAERLPPELRADGVQVRIDLEEGDRRVVALRGTEPRLTDAVESWRRSS
jgi:tRNA threonylcarbamoyladenosine biosynthesis protein TsaE